MTWNARICALALVALGGCLASPKNNDTLAHRNSSVSFQGYLPSTSSTQITAKAFNHSTNTWDAIGAPMTPMSSPAEVDSQGTSWFEFTGSFVMPQAWSYWMITANSYTIQLQAGGGQFSALNTFEGGPNAQSTVSCYEKFQAQGGVAIEENCKSAASPIVTLVVPCGAAGGDCCGLEPACKLGNNCTPVFGETGVCTSPCGATGQACCSSGFNGQTQCNAFNDCKSGSCAACGGEFQACCTTGAAACQSGYGCATTGALAGSCTPTCTDDSACFGAIADGVCTNGLCGVLNCTSETDCGKNRGCDTKKHVCVSFKDPCNCGSVGNAITMDGICCFNIAGGSTSVGSCSPSCLTIADQKEYGFTNLGCCGDCKTTCPN